jgi:hypothetical protein
MRDPKQKAARAHKPRRFSMLDKLRKRYRWSWLLWAALSAYLFLPALPSLRRSSSEPRPGVRIYAYDLPRRFNRAWVDADARCARHLFAAEVAVHEALLQRQRRSGLRAEEADLFLVPVYVSCNFSTPTGLPSLAHARGMLAEAMDLVRSMMNSEEQTTSSLRRTNSEHIPEESQQAQEPPSALFVFM